MSVSRRSPLSDASITAAAAELAAARAAGGQRQAVWQALSPAAAPPPMTTSGTQASTQAHTAWTQTHGADTPAKASSSGGVLTAQAEQQGSTAADHRSASHLGNGLPPQSAGTSVVPDLDGSPSGAVSLRVHYGGSRSRTPTPHPSEDGAPMVGRPSAAGAGESDGEGAADGLAVVGVLPLADRQSVHGTSSPAEHLTSPSAVDGDGEPTRHVPGVKPVYGAIALGTAGILRAWVDSTAVAKGATPAATHEAPPKSQLLPNPPQPIQQLRTPLVRWGSAKAPVEAIELAPAPAQSCHPANSADSAPTPPAVSERMQQGNDAQPAASVSPEGAPPDSTQLQAFPVSFPSQPANVHSMDPESKAAACGRAADGSVLQARPPVDTGRTADWAASAAVTPRKAAATPQRGLLARLPFAGVLRGRRWRRRSDGHMVDETILGARPPSHDGGMVAAGLCTPPRTPRRRAL